MCVSLSFSLCTYECLFVRSAPNADPVASTNLKDFYNLMDVYLDAVFFPNITPLTLQQEGWHYELDNPEEEMTYKGVVFNEMKGTAFFSVSLANEKKK